jgi:predicted phage terminase large subunit-like protein
VRAGRLEAALAGSTLVNFIRRMRPDYTMSRFHELVCNRLDAFLNASRAGLSPRLIICAPPRHGKSEIASRFFPAYVFGKYPGLSLIAASYGARLANKMSADVQRIIDSPRYREVFPGTRIPSRKGRAGGDAGYRRQADFFETVGDRGSYSAAGTSGGITGMGADGCIIVDDPVRSRADADSPVYRENVWDWYQNDLLTRCELGAGMVLIQTRWHEDDLAGRLQERARIGEGCEWETLSFPAIAERDEGWRREGDPLFPERIPLAKLEAFRRDMGEHYFASLFQQRPAPEAGAVFLRGWFRYWDPVDLPQKFDRMLMSWDMSFKDTAGSDFVVGQVWGRKGSDIFLLDQTRRRMGFVETCQAFRALADKWPGCRDKLVEDTANGPAVIDTLRRESGILGVIGVRPDGSKLARAHAVTAAMEAGNVHFPNGAPWRRDLEAELLSFPSGVHDDQVDALTQALRRFMSTPDGPAIVSGAPRSGAWGPPAASMRGGFYY